MHFGLCVICGTGSKEITLHMFPNPVRYGPRFDKWVSAVGAELHGLDKEYIFNNRRVCRKHFEYKYHNRNEKLNRLAVPTLFLKGGERTLHLTDQDYDVKRSNTMPGASASVTSEVSSSHVGEPILVLNVVQPTQIASPSTTHKSSLWALVPVSLHQVPNR